MYTRGGYQYELADTQGCPRRRPGIEVAAGCTAVDLELILVSIPVTLEEVVEMVVRFPAQR